MNQPFYRLFDGGKISNTWSDASRVAALAARKAHGGGISELDKRGPDLSEKAFDAVLT